MTHHIPRACLSGPHAPSDLLSLALCWLGRTLARIDVHETLPGSRWSVVAMPPRPLIPAAGACRVRIPNRLWQLFTTGSPPGWTCLAMPGVVVSLREDGDTRHKPILPRSKDSSLALGGLGLADWGLFCPARWDGMHNAGADYPWRWINDRATRQQGSRPQVTRRLR
ncbi:hypothetical protein B0T26DRAFT_400549 [Lasiosphaeria miniovina]|uniref:Uncharacterized protein n=1 Tax=Lasiosphaeria miniovina TaxID=1954250 RepID=A0AA40A4S0_9PEZI|nr:uncharacterized protein B0T26DRAFT_400549 [Lasiosphaeria miniovina]KAK0709284.1 hypothetical protein B0T26DRAFT_400549 [Lasiosphaeria miniovina]